MRLELKTGAVQLGPNQTLKVVDGAGSTVTAVQGAVWITERTAPTTSCSSPAAPTACASRVSPS